MVAAKRPAVWTKQYGNDHMENIHNTELKSTSGSLCWSLRAIVVNFYQKKLLIHIADKYILQTWIYESCYYWLYVEILRFDSSVWTVQKYWTVSCEQRVRSNFSTDWKFDQYCVNAAWIKLLIGSFSNDDGYGSENVAFKMY